jgi:hypothetical protein
MRRTLVALLIAAPVAGVAALWPGLARPTIDPSGCRLRHATTPIASLRELPASITRDIHNRIRPLVSYLESPVMSDRGGPFNATDAISDPAVPSRRFVHAGRSGDLWFVWYERGGRGYTTHLVIYRIPNEAMPAEPVLHLSIQPDNLCTATDGALDDVLAGRVAPDDWPANSW